MNFLKVLLLPNFKPFTFITVKPKTRIMRSTATLFSVFFFISFLASGQGVKAIAEYQQEFRADGVMRGTELSPEQRMRIARRMGEMPPREFTLTMAGQRSVYKQKASDESGRGQRRFGVSGDLYKDAVNRQSINKVKFQDSTFLVHDSLPKFNWELQEETTEIGPLLCYKATALVDDDAGRFGFGMRGGGSDESQRSPVEVTAWYCPEIKSDQGPGRYWGLPGLILEVETSNTLIRCTNIELFPEGLDAVNLPEEGTVITAREYGEKLMKFWEERREQRQQRN